MAADHFRSGIDTEHELGGRTTAVPGGCGIGHGVVDPVEEPLAVALLPGGQPDLGQRDLVGVVAVAVGPVVGVEFDRRAEQIRDRQSHCEVLGQRDRVLRLPRIGTVVGPLFDEPAPARQRREVGLENLHPAFFGVFAKHRLERLGGRLGKIGGVNRAGHVASWGATARQAR